MPVTFQFNGSNNWFPFTLWTGNYGFSDTDKRDRVSVSSTGQRSVRSCSSSTKNILFLESISFIAGIIIVWLVLNKWLQGFAYRTELSWWIFALTGIIALGIIVLAVSWQSWRAATRNPVEALRYE